MERHLGLICRLKRIWLADPDLIKTGAHCSSIAPTLLQGNDTHPMVFFIQVADNRLRRGRVSVFCLQEEKEERSAPHPFRFLHHIPNGILVYVRVYVEEITTPPSREELSPERHIFTNFHRGPFGLFANTSIVLAEDEK
ncbi:hypothetical protein MPLA_770066 [Mesorhizobium sp. ORS 3359]|nr:hypothetical protein MPLA_770066 [Mesorhizobium sp. ORS 3359]